MKTSAPNHENSTRPTMAVAFRNSFGSRRPKRMARGLPKLIKSLRLRAFLPRSAISLMSGGTLPNRTSAACNCPRSWMTSSWVTTLSVSLSQAMSQIACIVR
ncbi:hypothetical protein D9M70_484290 [compost metagenome]